MRNQIIYVSNLQMIFYIDKRGHSWGVTLESLIIITADEQWRKCYLDRTENSNKFIAINKLFELTNLALYWNSTDKFINPN